MKARGFEVEHAYFEKHFAAKLAGAEGASRG